MRRKTDRAAYHANIRNAEKRGCPSGFKLHENQPGEGAAPPSGQKDTDKKPGPERDPAKITRREAFRSFHTPEIIWQEFSRTPVRENPERFA